MNTSITLNSKVKYNIAESWPFVSEKETIKQPPMGDLRVQVTNPHAVYIHMGSSEELKSEVIAVDRSNIDRLIYALRWAKLSEGDFFFHAKRYFRKARKLKPELWPKSKYEIQEIQNEFEDWCMANEEKIRKRIARDKANSVSKG